MQLTAFQGFKSACINFCYLNDECLIGMTVVQIQIDDVSIVMKVKRDNSILSMDIVLPEWVFSSLILCPGIICNVNPVNIVTLSDTMTLCFSSCRCLKQWDEESASTFSFGKSSCWSDQWPESVDVEILESMCSMLLCGDYVGGSTTMALKIMDFTMLFKVKILSENDDNSSVENNTAMRTALTTKYKIQRTALSKHHEELTSESLEATNVTCLSTLPTSTANKIRLHSELLFDQHTDSDGIADKAHSRPALVRSILLCGPEGAGKSHLLRRLQSDLCHCDRHTPLCITINASAPNVNKPAVEKALRTVFNFRVEKDSKVSENVQFACVYLSVLLEILEVDSAIRLNATSALQQGQCLFLVVDDLDSLLAQYGAASDSMGGDDGGSAYEGPAVVSPGNELQIVGHVLSKLLMLLAPSCTSNERSSRVMVVGVCRLDLKAVPRAHTGCPEFELHVLLPRMSSADRASAVLDMLTEQLSLQPTSLETFCGVFTSHGGVAVGQSDLDVNLTRWASRVALITAGYLPGDLTALIRHTFLIHRGRMEAVSMSASHNDNTLLWATLLQALLSLPPKQLQSLGIDSSSGSSSGGPQQQTRLSWADFAGYAHEVRQVKRLFANPCRADNEQNGAAGGPPSLLGLFSCPKGIVLHGPTGCGKSMLARVIAAEANMNFVAIRSTEILSQYFGETEASVRGLFARARAASPCVLFFDEFDAIAHKRGGGDDSTSGLHGRILSTFLNELDGVSGGGGGGFESSVLVLVASTDLASLDEALLRPGRLQHHVFLGKPSLEDVQAIVVNQMRRMPCVEAGGNEAIDVSRLCARLMSASPSCADAEALCHKALSAAIREQILASQQVVVSGDDVSLPTRRVVCQRHFDEALRELSGWSDDVSSDIAARREEMFSSSSSSSSSSFVFESTGEFHF